jgi:hypothetical protein
VLLNHGGVEIGQGLHSKMIQVGFHFILDSERIPNLSFTNISEQRSPLERSESQQKKSESLILQRTKFRMELRLPLAVAPIITGWPFW